MTGHNSLRMTDLALLYKDIGFTDAETYIQSGNVIFNAEDNLPGQDIASKIEQSILGSEIYLHCPNGFGRTKLYTNFFEKKMGVIGTARNLNTITMILSLAEKSHGLQ
jgi:uncharacterized protein (DUF1697 family)